MSPAGFPPPSVAPVARAFGRAATVYHRHAGAQERVAARLDAALQKLPPPRSIWEIGCGSGLLTERLTRRWPGVPLTAQDGSEAMLMEAASRLPGHGIIWHCGDARREGPETPVDMIVSSSALHWLGDPAFVFPALWSQLAPGGCLAAGLMLDGTLRELRALRMTLRPEPGAVPLPRLGDWLAALPGDAQLLAARTWEEIEWFSSARDALRAIRGQGVNAAPYRAAPPLAPADLRAIISAWEQSFAVPGRGVPCTYHAGLMIVRKEPG